MDEQECASYIYHTHTFTHISSTACVHYRIVNIPEPFAALRVSRARDSLHEGLDLRSECKLGHTLPTYA